MQCPQMEAFLSQKSADVLHRYFLKSRQYVRAAEVMFTAAFKVSARGEGKT